MNRTVLFTILLTSFVFISFSTENKLPKYRIKTIVIDPGHGGHDSGCLGSSSYEKHVALAVSLKLGAMIEEYFPDVKVIYTRETDVFVELHERAAIANRAKADLFVCIHCNSEPSAAFGAETYVMGLHKTADNLSVAKRENSSILLEKNYKSNYDGFDPNSPEANIIFSLYQNTFMNQSLLFASHLQKQFEHNSGRFNRGVKQAGFLVLFRTAMPSVLIELGFLTNKSDEKYLASEKGQQSMAQSILKAFQSYKSETERKAGGNHNDDDPSESNDKNQAAKPEETAPKKENEPVLEVKNTDNQSTEPKPISDSLPVTAPLSRVFFTVQVGAVANASKADAIKFEKIEGIRPVIGDDGMTRFYSGVFDSADSARKSQEQLKTKGFKDSFIVAFSGAKRISVSDANDLLKRK